jgi:hypothetical protein
VAKKIAPNMCPICSQKVDANKDGYYYMYPWLGNMRQGYKVHRGKCLAEASRLHKENECEDPLEDDVLFTRTAD